MPNLPPFFNGKINGVLTLSVSDLSLFKNNIKSTYVQFEWSGSREKQKLSTSKYSKLMYDIRTSYKSFLNYISTCTLKCSVKSYDNKTLARAYLKNLLIVTQDNQMVKTISLINNEEKVGIIQLYFNLQIFNDVSFDNDIKALKQFGIKNDNLNTLNNKELYYSEILNQKQNVRPINSLSLKTNKSKEELTNNYLMGKDMAPEEEEEAFSTLRTMPSVETIISAAEKIDICSPPQTQLCVQGHAKMTTIRPDIQNIKTVKTNLKNHCQELNLNTKTMPNHDVYLHLSILSINVYRTIKSLKYYLNSTYIVQCLKDQEPCKSLRFMSRHVDDNVVKFKNTIQSSRLEGCTVKGIIIKAYVRLLSTRSPIILGETKQMLDWPGLSTTFGVSKYIKVPIWNNDKIVGHLSLSYEFSKTPVVQKHEENFTEKHIEYNIIEKENHEEQQCEPSNSSKPVVTITKNEETNYNDTVSYQMKNQAYLYSRLYPETNDKIIENQFILDDWPKIELRKMTKNKEIQTNFYVRQLNKSVQTLIKTINVAVQVESDELDDFPDKTISYDVQNIFRCTHEFTFNFEKKCNSIFNYITYQFPECVTNNTGKVITCCRMFRTFGNSNILHLITLPTIIPLETYFYNNYKKGAIILNLHQNNDYSPGKVSLLVSQLIDMATEYKTSYVTKNLILNNNLSICGLSNINVHIQIHYKRVYHSFPSPEKQLTNSCASQKPKEKKSKIIVDLTESESDSEDSSINKTYTLFKHDKIVEKTTECGTQTDTIPGKISRNSKTQTEKYMLQQCIITNDDNNTIVNKVENSTQTDIVNNQEQTQIKINPQRKIFTKFYNNNIFKAKIIIIGGYNLPMVKLNGDTIPSAPTTYVIMEDYGGGNLSTSSVVQQTNPIWNSKWTVVLPKNKLIEEKWLILELWCKKYKNEYAGHDAKRDARLGFILIDLCSLDFDHNLAYGLYDVISETEERNGKIKVMIELVDSVNSQINDNSASQSINISQIVHNKRNSINQKSNEKLINEMLGRIKIGNNYHTESKEPKSSVLVNNKKCDYIDLTEDTPQKVSETLLKNTAANTGQRYCFSNNDCVFDMGTISSVTSWTSSSDDILCSNNSRIVFDILHNETKMKRIKKIIQS